ncbi:hypothetical protein P170DRAFT_441799 [Aspergillus steynii IBT 23096]|uniref:Uncharacterized protein n=1 Tax=Aspergillus steynii IBT 23096 TaxID=1392250 RepID=A0A2I2FS09_9EURO|nr:uncharacterized protein P170DRAFT_441799 [Aspergillus steynii IBT 23096]PLB43397.1 hypothetical protein P170DRAFT_441799 [Aspergillus steynii IBT 23096]
MRFLSLSAALVVGCLGAPLFSLPTSPLISKEQLTQSGDVKNKKRADPITEDGNVDPVNDGEVNNNISLLRFC